MPVEKAPLRAGDLLTVGAFEIRLEEEEPRPARTNTVMPEELEGTLSGLGNATIIRPLADFAAAYGLGERRRRGRRLPAGAGDGRPIYVHRMFGFLTRLARMLTVAESVDDVLSRVLDLAFEAFPVDRGFILLSDDSGELVCELARLKEKIAVPPGGGGAGVAHHAAGGDGRAGGARHLRRPGGPAPLGGRVDPPAPDPLGDVRAALVGRADDGRHPGRLPLPRRRLRRARPRRADHARQLRGGGRRAHPLREEGRVRAAGAVAPRALPLAGGHRGGAAPGRRGDAPPAERRGDGALRRPGRVYSLCGKRSSRAGRGIDRRLPRPLRRGDLPRRGDPRQVHRRLRDGLLRRPGGAGRSCPAGGAGGGRDPGGARGLERRPRGRGPARLQGPRRPQQRPGGGGGHRQRPARGLHGARQYGERRVAPGGGYAAGRGGHRSGDESIARRGHPHRTVRRASAQGFAAADPGVPGGEGAS